MGHTKCHCRRSNKEAKQIRGISDNQETKSTDGYRYGRCQFTSGKTLYSLGFPADSRVPPSVYLQLNWRCTEENPFETTGKPILGRETPPGKMALFYTDTGTKTVPDFNTAGIDTPPLYMVYCSLPCQQITISQNNYSG